MKPTYPELLKAFRISYKCTDLTYVLTEEEFEYLEETVNRLKKSEDWEKESINNMV